MWGYIDTRFLGDFMPLLILGRILGMVLLLGLSGASTAQVASGGRGSGGRTGVCTAWWQTSASPSRPTIEFRAGQLVRYVDFQKTVGDLIGHSVSADVVHGKTLPYWAPADELFVVGDCAGFYFSTGQTFNTIPKQQLQHRTWLAVVETPGSLHRLKITLNEPPAALGAGVPVVTVGRDTIWMEPAGPDQIRFRLSDPRYPTTGAPVWSSWTDTFGVSIMTDINLESVNVDMNRRQVINGRSRDQGSRPRRDPRQKRGGVRCRRVRASAPTCPSATAS